jgi:sugar phosphate isomerase/epimerase
MKNQIIISTGSCHRYGLQRFFEIAKKAGFKQMELIIDDRLDSQDPVYIKKLERKFGLKVVSVHSAMEFVYSWGDWKSRVEKSIKLAKELKAKFIIIHSWEYSDPKYVTWMMKNQKTIYDLAKPIKVVFENATKRDDFTTGNSINPSYHFDVMKEFDSINFDLSHCATAEIDILEYFTAIQDRINHIHFSDSDFRPHPKKPGNIEDCHLLPGKGKLPLKKFLKLLKEKKYSGPISIELWCDQFANKKGIITEESVIKNLKAAKKFVETYCK